MKAPPVPISCHDLTLRFPVYGVDAKSLKKHLAKITVGGSLGRSHGTTEVTALSNLNLELKAGDRLGLVGHNGSGKTTLLRALSGAYEPDEGTIEVQGHIAALLDLNLGIDPSATSRARCMAFTRSSTRGRSTNIISTPSPSPRLCSRCLRSRSSSGQRTFRPARRSRSCASSRRCVIAPG